MKALFMVLFAAVAAAGCAGHAHVPEYTQRESELPEPPAWSPTDGTIAVTTSGRLPERVLLLRRTRVLNDTAKGAWDGLWRGLKYNAVAGGAGMILGGIGAAVDGETVESAHALSRLDGAPSILHDALGRNDLEGELAHAMVARSETQGRYTLRRFCADARPPASGSACDTHERAAPVASPGDALAPRPATADEIQDILRAGEADGVLVLRIVQLGFAHEGRLDPDDVDPEVAVVTRAQPTLHFIAYNRVQRIVFETREYEGAKHRLSDLSAEDGALLDRGLERGAQVLSERLLTDLSREVAVRVTASSERRPRVSPYHRPRAATS